LFQWQAFSAFSRPDKADSTSAVFAKGREYCAVTLLIVDGACIPSDVAAGTTAELGQDWRSLNVAMIRAKDA
jgi:hypothetical protein